MLLTKSLTKGRPLKLVFFLILSIYIFSSSINFEQILFNYKSQLTYYFKTYPLWSNLVSSVIYIFLTALSFPLAYLLTLIISSSESFLPALINISISSTIGATLAMLLTRYFLKNYLKNKFNQRIDQIITNFNVNGINYLIALRLNPVIPFFLVNIGFGFTKIKTKVYFFVTMLFMLPGTILYVLAGQRLREINSTKDLIGPNGFWALVLLSLASLLIPKLAKLLRSNQQ